MMQVESLPSSMELKRPPESGVDDTNEATLRSLRESKMKMFKEDDDLYDDLISEHESAAHVLSISSASGELTELDTFSNLPETWANLDFQKKKSFILSSVYSTSVTKAINHLELLQISIDKWVSQIHHALPGSASSAESSKKLINYIRRRDNNKIKTELKFVEKPESNAGALEVCGKGTEVVVKQNQEPVEDLKVGGILEEILVLVARLEFDRRRIELLLRKEIEVCIKLKEKLEQLSLRRAIELPLRVQREHEACITDITELKWHISFNTKAERKLTHKIENEEVLQEQLKSDLLMLRTNIPLLEEKISNELAILKEIADAQEEVDDLLDKAKEKLAETQERYEASLAKAEKEREAIRADLDDARRQLNKAKKRLKLAEETCKEYLATIESCTKKIKENEEQEKIEVQKRLELRTQNEDFKEKLKFLQEERFRIAKEIERVRGENAQHQKEIDEKTQKYKAEIDKLTEVMNRKIDKMEKILKKNQEKEINIEEMTKDKASLEQKIGKDDRNRERLLDQQKLVKQEYDEVMNNHAHAVALNEAANKDYTKELEKYEKREESMRKRINELKKQKIEERNMFNSILGRLRIEEEEFAKTKAAANEKKKQFETKKAELDKRLNELENRVNGIEARKVALDTEIASLTENLRSILDSHVKLEAELRAKIAEAEPKHKQIADEHSPKKSRVDYMKTHTVQMNEKMIEMDENKVVMLKQIEKMLAEIEDLEKIYKEESIKCEANRNLDMANQKQFETTSNRVETYERNHQKYLLERNAYLTRLRDQLNEYLALNKELASRYRYLKYDMYNVKFKLLRQLESKLGTLLSVKDKRQLKVLQERMHTALRDYFIFKIKDGENDLYELNDKRNLVGDKLESIETFLYNSIDYMTDFLDNQIDFSEVRQQAMQKVYKEELLERQKQQQQHQDAAISSSQIMQPIIKTNKKVEFVDAV